ncbi:MAG: Na+/H+ antiporter subunit E [Rickettsiaceae bacterium]|nr:Na+/H+ antiporter subunit E [Rickettsiaceae bacterium]
MGTRIYLFCVCYFIWLSLTGFSLELSALVTAFVVSSIVVLFAHKLEIYLPYNKIFWGQFLSYIAWIAKEVVTSSWKISNIVWRKNLFIKPSLEQIKTNQATELGVVIYANSITITPGTVTIANQDNNLLVHALDISFMEDLQSGQMEEKVKKVIRVN